MSFEKKIIDLKLELPEAKAPVGSYLATKITGNLLFISGQISMTDNGELIKGKLGKDLKTDDGYKVTNPEGFVAFGMEGGAVKLNDRLEFNKANFNQAKSWSK